MKMTEKTAKKHIDLGQILASGTRSNPQPCIYCLINDENEVVFVGQARNLQSRLLEHRVAGVNFVRFRYFTCDETELDRLEKEAIARFNPALNKPSKPTSTSGLLSKQLICLKHNITPVAFERLRDAFNLKPSGSFGNARFYKPEDVEVWIRQFKGLIGSGRYVLQAKPTYLAVGISSRTRQIQLFTK
ncbi:GIY-YIG nuclease family protein [Spirosoma aerophilum]